MGYRIIYGDNSDELLEKHPLRRFLLTMCCFGCFLWTVCCCWPEGRDVLKGLFIPGNPETTLEAVQVFAQELRCGYSLVDAADNFREAVLSGGYPG